MHKIHKILFIGNFKIKHGVIIKLSSSVAYFIFQMSCLILFVMDRAQYSVIFWLKLDKLFSLESDEKSCFYKSFSFSFTCRLFWGKEIIIFSKLVHHTEE